MAWNWRVLVGLSFAVLLFGAALIAMSVKVPCPNFVGLGSPGIAVETKYWPSTY